MENILPVCGTRRESIVQCPLCKGLGRRVLGNRQRFDPPCDLCYGTGIIDRDHTCVCGRSLRLTDQGLVFANVFSCGREECKKKLTPAAPQRLTKQYEVDFTPPFDDDTATGGQHWRDWDDAQLHRYFRHHGFC
jgi:hypothetical protein